jgi:DNA-directed RNA polymerase subunit RPC12/RpoP
MATCKDCLHVEICKFKDLPAPLSDSYIRESECIEKRCGDFKDRSRFVELKHAEWDEHEDMYGDPFYSCSNCRENYFLEEWTPIENRYFYCPNCGAKMDKPALKEGEEND